MGIPNMWLKLNKIILSTRFALCMRILKNDLNRTIHIEAHPAKPTIPMLQSVSFRQLL